MSKCQSEMDSAMIYVNYRYESHFDKTVSKCVQGVKPRWFSLTEASNRNRIYPPTLALTEVSK